MKKFIVLLLIVFVSIGIFAYAGVTEAQKFNVSYTITYNELTLEEAARLETVIKNEFKDACKVSMNIKESTSNSWVSPAGTLVEW